MTITCGRQIRKKKHRKRLLLAVATALLALVVVPLWLAVHFVPSWYQPPTMTTDDLRRARASLPNTLQQFTDLLVAGEPFTFELSDAMVNQWLAARASIWPDSAKRWPEQLFDPVICFNQDHVIVAGRLVSAVAETIVSLHWTVAAQADDLTIRCVDAKLGALSAPNLLLNRLLDANAERLRGASADWSLSVRDWLEPLFARDAGALFGRPLQRPNRFVWPNGKRPFTINGLEAENGMLTVRITPLAD